MCFPTEVKAKVRIRFGFFFCVLWKEVIYSPPYRDPATETCWEAPQKKKTKKTTCDI